MALKEAMKRFRKDLKDFWFAGIMILIYGIITHFLFDQFCPLRILTGIPCAGCGITRAFFYLMTGNFEKVMQYNCCIIIWIPTIGCAILERYFGNKKWKITKVLFFTAGIAALLYYIYRMRQFPNGLEPIVYFKGNIMRHFLPFYDQMLQKIFQM